MRLSAFEIVANVLPTKREMKSSGMLNFFVFEDGKWYFRGKWLYTRTVEGYSSVDVEGGPMIGVNSRFSDFVSVWPEHDFTITKITPHKEGSFELEVVL